MDKENRSQGVDIDLDALCVAQRRIGRTDKRAKLIQSAQYSSTGAMRVLEAEEEAGLVDDGEAGSGEKGSESEPTTPRSSSSTWSKGATSDRFERRFQARLAKEQLTQARAARADEANGPAPGGEAMTLLHADVLSLPMAEAGVEAPDLVYAGNYALSYFHDRKSLLAYLRQCRRTLRPQTGVLIVDPFAGPTNWEARTDEERNEQHSLWTRFANEPGFLRSNEGDPPAPLKSDDLEVWKPTPAPAARSDWRSWPRGRLVLVREGHVCGGYEYWREDGPIDYVTNRFRMSLSFRFRDGSWLRDYFSYDFRVWSLCEITEAMEEVGFERIQVHAIPRQSSASNERRNSHDDGSGQGNSKSGSDSGSDVDNGLGGMATLLQRTEREEADKLTYVHVEQEEKLFATKSFGSESGVGHLCVHAGQLTSLLQPTSSLACPVLARQRKRQERLDCKNSTRRV